MSRTKNPLGSVWNRWEPHIHVPGTVLNDQYGALSVEDFCRAINDQDQPIRALGVTDYLVTDSYQLLRTHKADGRLPNVDLLFPNIEVRLDVGTVKGRAVNAHLLFSPDDANHLDQIHRFLAGLKFRYADEDYFCTSDDLKRLGRKHDPSITDNRLALQAGVNQFKVSITAIVDLVKNNKWSQNNMLIAVAASSQDGSSGVRTSDGAFDALRDQIQHSSHIIFSGNPKDVEFWCGRGVMSPSEIQAKYRSLKPCLHGSDAHEANKIGRPDEDRLCWIKGDVTFEALRQACIEPSGRVFIGPEPPRGAQVGETVSRLNVTNATWMIPSELGLNPGMVAIIGARGSGKTALADMIAVGAYSMSAHVNERSFIRRAERFLGNSTVTLNWESSEQTVSRLADFSEDELFEEPRVQYLSQQFVDELCASDGVADRLLQEIERVIFNSHSEIDREDATNFAGLFNLTCQAAIDERKRAEQELSALTNQYVQYTLLEASGTELKKRIEQESRRIEQLTKERQGLVAKGQEGRIARQQEVLKAQAARKGALEAEQKKRRSFQLLLADVADFRQRVAKGWLDEKQSLRSEAGLTADEWNSLMPSIAPKADEILQGKTEIATKATASILGSEVKQPEESNLQTPLLRDSDDLMTATVNLLTAEANRLSRLIGIDRAKSLRFSNFTTQLQTAEKQVGDLTTQLKKANDAAMQLKQLRTRRRELYRRAFSTFPEFTLLLERLYDPLQKLLSQETGALAKMKFAVNRSADVAAWADAGEDIFDLRKDGPFKGRGALQEAATSELLDAWEDGTPEEAEAAVDAFVEKYRDSIKYHQLDSIPKAEWQAKVWTWLFATDHIRVSYGLQYAGINIEKLSPGTRGIVLLLLYLAIDQHDMRPLIIDQPEENLDPQSIYEELVSRFRSAKERRQIIVVTHNANLVVNADADQIIVAEAGEHEPGKLPEIKYISGGLEDQYIRGKVCQILEGGENAFRERAKRLRIVL